MGGPEVYAEKPKEKTTVIKEVTFKVGNKIYTAKFEKAPKIGEVKAPKGKTPKEVNAEFAKMADSYNVVIYEKGSKKPIEDPSVRIKATAGKVLLRESIIKSIDVKELVPKLAQ